ncbi:MAG: family 43 glycosylhydrolase [Sporolactobacillus sp.]|jgi:GH43 family beta-xylosidase|nr:family 43 glycosylhydrolase [Sporolactobacillus sp.]
MDRILNPIVLQRADPFVYRHSDGYYYFTGSYPKYDRIILRRAKHLNDLQDAEEYVLWRRHTAGPMSHLIWAPELHYIDRKWYIYFAAAPNNKSENETFNHRIFVLENDGTDPLCGRWVEKGQIHTGWETFALDSTSFIYQETQYLVWAQQDLQIAGHSNLYIARMKNPWTLDSQPTMLSKPELPWEIKGFWVNEGPAVLVKNGKIFLTYSASATGTDYCMGMLTASADADLLDRSSWIKRQQPVFQSCAKNHQYGPGHNSFTESEDGTQTIVVYHARNYTHLVGDPLYEPNRHARAQVVHFDRNGDPLFGYPLPDDRWTPRTAEILP